MTSFRTALEMLGGANRLKFWTLSVIRGLLGLLDIAALLLLALAVNVLTADVRNGGELNADISQIIKAISAFTSVNRSNIVFLLAAGVLLLFVGKAVISATLTFQMNQYLSRCEITVTNHLTGKLMNAVQSHGLLSAERVSYALTFGTSALVSRGLGALSTLVAESITLLAVLTVLLVYQPITTGIAILYFAMIGMALVIWVGGKTEVFGRINTDSLSRASVLIRDSIGAQRELYLAGKIDWSVDKVTRLKGNASTALGSASTLAAMPRFVIETALVVGAFILAAFEFRFFNLETAVTGLTVFLAGGSRIAPSLLTVVSSFATLRQVSPDARVALDIEKQLNGGVVE